MRTSRPSGLLAHVSIAVLLATAVPALAQTAPAAGGGVTFERLLNPDKEPQNWLTYNRSYDGQRFSPLDQINKDTVKNLKLAYSVSLAPPLGVAGTYKYAGLTGTPIVVDGRMYVTDGFSRVYKLDVRSGKRAAIEWIMDPQYQTSSIRSEPPNNKGVAILGNTVFSVVLDGRLVATNAETGEVLWEKKVIMDPREEATAAPLVVKDLVIITSANGDRGSRGWIQARRVKDGELAWIRYTIPAPGEPGSESWQDPKKEAWKDGGGAPWNTATYDASTDTLYIGTGQPFPDYDPDARPGDNLYTNSLLALDTATGNIKWHFQYTPNESWDYDEQGAHVLVDSEVGGEKRRLVTHFGRNGMYYGLDRTNGSFVNGGKYVNKVTWTKGLDPKTGKPVEYDPTKAVQSYVPTIRPGGSGGKVEEACPSLQGGTNYFPVSYNPQTKKLYAVSHETCALFPEKGSGGRLGEQARGSVVMLDPATGTVTKKRETPFVQYGGALATAGGLVFSNQMDGTFEAMDATSLEPLWSINLGAQINAPPMTFSVNGKQYVALLVGGGPVGELLGYLAKGGDPDVAKNMQPTAVLYVFSL
ncbi:PQQ-binding-like beta-propeller repeat protein [Alsobacter sp. SYSU M60028]|uniref:PQQ-binding-like beta-propeller repeat protein n=1 Tax=Alsobacter ponti TaxID=2962936 RepID=A0ABT1LDN2_9HYPH|nr:PQQ-binding-like beta-propeller repeat protein [Alsobacter ponti]MCP8939612.1 PQQ-binding-like beta-propeller repeat protein [Alsobacter ponti]